MGRTSRRWTVAALVAALPLCALLVAPVVGARLIRTRALPRLEQRLGRPVTVGAIRVRWGRADLEDVGIAGDGGGPPPVQLPLVSVHFDVGALLRGRVALTRVAVVRPRIDVIRDAVSGVDNLSSLLARLRDRRSDGSRSSGGARVSGPTEVDVSAGTLSFYDDELGALDVKDVSARLRRDGACHAELGGVTINLPAGLAATGDKVAADFRLADGHLDGLPALSVAGGGVRVWKGFALSGVEGEITPDPGDPARANVDLRGGYGGVARVLWDAKGWVRPAERQADVQLNAARFDLSQIAPILAGTPVIEPERAQVDARLRVKYHPTEPAATDPHHLGDVVDFDGSFHLAGLSVFHPMLGPQPVTGLGFDADVAGRLAPKRRTLHVDHANVHYRGLDATFTAHAEKLGKKPAFDAWFALAPVPCQTVLEALPSELTPALRGFRLAGTFQSRIHLAIDLSDLDQGVDLGGSVGIDGCSVTAAPEMASSDRLVGSFDQAVEMAPGEWMAFTVGPENPDWVPYADLSPHLVNSIMTTEDSGFMRHRGFIPSEFASALKSNLEHGYFHLGASSITMQMVKNVVLSREKTLARKLQEMFLTWYVERHLTKERILEIYFNVIEFGPGIYGIGRASRHYFGKSAKELSPREAAWFSSILPNPKRRYAHFCKGPALDAKWELYLNRILRRMHERGRLTDEDFADAINSALVFDRAEAKPERECLEIVKRFTTPAAAVSDGLAARATTDEDGAGDEPQ